MDYETRAERIREWSGIVLGILALVISVCALLFGRADQSLNRQLQQHGKQLERRTKLARTLDEFQNVSSMYFVANAGNQYMHETTTDDPNHIEYHRLNAELNSSVEEARRLFGPCVSKLSDRLINYLNASWEQQLQDSSFCDKVKAIGSTGEIQPLIRTELVIEEYEYLGKMLKRFMDEETVSLDTPPILPGRNCELVEATVDIASDPPSPAVGEIVNLTPTVNGMREDMYYKYAWTGDHGLESRNRLVNCRYHDPGIKLICLKVTFLGPPEEGDFDRSKVMGVFFAQKRIVVSAPKSE